MTVLFGHFTENPEAPHQAVTANNLGNQASSAIPESGQQHPFDAVVTSCSGNGKSRRRIVSECFTVYYFTVILLLRVSCFLAERQGARHGASGAQQDSLREYGGMRN